MPLTSNTIPFALAICAGETEIWNSSPTNMGTLSSAKAVYQRTRALRANSVHPGVNMTPESARNWNRTRRALIRN